MSRGRRSDPAQAGPDPHRDYSGFPSATVRAGLRRWRVHQRRHSPWFFASGPGGRFNLDPPHGTLYVASRPEVALREAAGTLLVGAAVVDSDWADQRVVTALVVGRRKVANLRSSRAPAFGIVPGEITGPFTDYQLTRAWARTFHGCGFGGVRYSSRFSSAQGRFCEAAFGPAGAADGDIHQSMTVRAMIAQMPGYRVIDRPSSLDITIISGE